MKLNRYRLTNNRENVNNILSYPHQLIQIIKKKQFKYYNFQIKQMIGSGGSESSISQEKKPFVLNKLQLTDLGFDFTDQGKESAINIKLYDKLACPFEQKTKIHPLRTHFPQAFLSFDFQFQKMIDKLTDETLIYIFYNIMDERMQLTAARIMMKKYMKYHKHDRVWVRKKQNRFEYFNIHDWEYQLFEGNINQNFATQDDFAQR